MRYFIFCKDELLLRCTDNGCTIPEGEVPPVELKPWTHVMNVEGDQAFSIDQPVSNMKGYEMCGLRKSYYKLSHEEYLKAGKCHELLYWDRNTRFCGVCGGTMKLHFYGVVAGFVETGETLEEAVHREVMEETGITITNLRYFGSQPWPYPCGLMVGFNADYVEGEIHLQRSELSKGAWFNKENLPTIPEKLSIARKLIDAWIEG